MVTLAALFLALCLRSSAKLQYAPSFHKLPNSELKVQHALLFTGDTDNCKRCAGVTSALAGAVDMQRNSSARFLHVDCAAERAVLCKHYSLDTSRPHLRWWDAGGRIYPSPTAWIELPALNSMQALSDLIQRMERPPVLELKAHAIRHFEEVVRERGTENVLFILAGEPPADVLDIFNDVARKARDSCSFVRLHGNELSPLGLPPTAEYYAARIELTGSLDVQIFSKRFRREDFSGWVRLTRFPQVLQISQNNFEAFFSAFPDRLIALAVLDSSSSSMAFEASVKVIADARESTLAPHALEMFKFGALNHSVLPRFLEQFSIQRLPALLVINVQQKIFYLDSTVKEEEDMESW
jgi:Thioredoxin-like domain